MNLIQSACLNEHEPFAYLKDVSSPACQRSRRAGLGVAAASVETGVSQSFSQEGVAGCLRRFDQGKAL